MKTRPAPRKTRGRKDYSIQRGHKSYFPLCSYTHWSEGDTTFASQPDRRLGRKAKKWMRKQLHLGPYKPWWTNHNTRAVTIPGGIIR